jgi:hypothetical protein
MITSEEPSDATVNGRPYCRGCEKECVYYAECDGKLWRMKDHSKPETSHPETRVPQQYCEVKE